jgi:hypothetical protein
LSIFIYCFCHKFTVNKTLCKQKGNETAKKVAVTADFTVYAAARFDFVQYLHCRYVWTFEGNCLFGNREFSSVTG